jgi:hypothetical protein
VTLADVRRDGKGELKMRPTAGYGALTLMLLVLALELLGAGAYVVSGAQATPNDFCFGYAVCR